MQAKTTHHPTSRFIVLDLAVEAIETLRPVVARIQRQDRDLANQLRRALSSIALNIGEGNRSQGGNRIARFSTAAGSNAEARTALRVAVAWGYVKGDELELGEKRLDRIAGMLFGLGARW
jgi:four helix bundle protein